LSQYPITMKVLFIFITSVFILISNVNGINIVYKSDLPDDRSGLIYFKKTGKNSLDRSEKILKEAEKEIIQFAKDKEADLIEIYVLDKENGEIPTESQVGKVGYVEILFSLKKN
jgi:hypothetical protein